MAEMPKVEVTEDLLNFLGDVWNDESDGQEKFVPVRIVDALERRYQLSWKTREQILLIGQFYSSIPTVREETVGRLLGLAPGLIFVDLDRCCNPWINSGLLTKKYLNYYVVNTFGLDGRLVGLREKGDAHISLHSTEMPYFKDCAARFDWDMGHYASGGDAIGIANHRWPFMQSWIERWLGFSNQ
ncbi:MAG: hypothetical protein Q8R36_01275 [bacterium]|nr:hypothetical protein [bacterium]